MSKLDLGPNSGTFEKINNSIWTNLYDSEPKIDALNHQEQLLVNFKENNSQWVIAEEVHKRRKEIVSKAIAKDQNIEPSQKIKAVLNEYSFTNFN